MMNFEEAVKYLLGLGHETLTIKLGLRNTELLLDALDNPERAFPSVQIAGTNGKGSTAAMLDSICRAAGIKCGLYTSPHLVSITERIRVSGVEITQQDFAACATTVRYASEQLLADKQIEALPTFFEQLTAIALVAFRNASIELAILETGLGGRLDSTTAAKASIIAITQIALDHQEYLGHTLESIAAEKAAIIRRGVNAVIARQEPEALQVLLKRCEETGVTPVLENGAHTVDGNTPDGKFRVTFDTGADHYESVLLGLRGRHQIDNAAVAIQLAELLRLPHSAIVTGIETASHPGRLEMIPHQPPFLLDGAHNPAGCQSLRAYLEEFGPASLTLVFGAMADKPYGEMLDVLEPLATHMVLTRAADTRAASPEVLRKAMKRKSGSVRISLASNSIDALHEALNASEPGGWICVTGSLYMVGEFRDLLCGNRDKLSTDLKS